MAKAVWLKNGNEKIYPAPYWPIGSIYISVVNTNPSQWFGGTWQSFGSGRVLVGVDSNQSEFSTVEKTGGEKTHILSISEMPSHNHPIKNDNVGGGVTTYNTAKAGDKRGWAGNIYTDNSGGGKAHNNLQPYITVYMWRRVS